MSGNWQVHQQPVQAASKHFLLSAIAAREVQLVRQQRRACKQSRSSGRGITPGHWTQSIARPRTRHIVTKCHQGTWHTSTNFRYSWSSSHESRPVFEVSSLPPPRRPHLPKPGIGVFLVGAACMLVLQFVVRFMWTIPAIRGFFQKFFWWLLPRKKKAAARGSPSLYGVEDAEGDDVTAMVLYSDVAESVEWVNMCWRKAWRVYQRGLERWIADLLQPVFDNLVADKAVPRFVQRLRILEFTLDHEAPYFDNMRRRTSRKDSDLNGVVDVRYTGGAKMLLLLEVGQGRWRLKVPVLVSDLDLECKMWVKVRLAPMCPYLGTISLAFVGPPTIKVQLLPYSRVRLMRIPVLQAFLRRLLTVDLPNLMVLPKRLEINIPPAVTAVAEAAVGRDAVMRAVASAVLQADALEHTLFAALPLGPQSAAGGVSLPDSFCGELQVTLCEARNLPVWGMPWQSNPYCRLLLGNQAVSSRRDDDTSHDGRHRAPVWNQEFLFLVEDPNKQVLELTVRDSHLTGRSELGTVRCPLKDLPTDRCMSVWLPVIPMVQGHKQEGELLLELTYKPFEDDEFDSGYREAASFASSRGPPPAAITDIKSAADASSRAAVAASAAAAAVAVTKAAAARAAAKAVRLAQIAQQSKGGDDDMDGGNGTGGTTSENGATPSQNGTGAHTEGPVHDRGTKQQMTDEYLDKQSELLFPSASVRITDAADDDLPAYAMRTTHSRTPTPPLPASTPAVDVPSPEAAERLEVELETEIRYLQEAKSDLLRGMGDRPVTNSGESSDMSVDSGSSNMQHGRSLASDDQPSSRDALPLVGEVLPSSSTEVKPAQGSATGSESSVDGAVGVSNPDLAASSWILPKGAGDEEGSGEQSGSTIKKGVKRESFWRRTFGWLVKKGGDKSVQKAAVGKDEKPEFDPLAPVDRIDFPPDLPMEAIVEEVQKSWKLKEIHVENLLKGAVAKSERPWLILLTLLSAACVVLLMVVFYRLEQMMM